ncbi:MAG: anhydro-N-acetylmuramic acid kinase [Bacteroidetes bacterium]|nr:anhydro-N-acetylmuramic acid kinase [Bacteroidota bacterium]
MKKITNIGGKKIKKAVGVLSGTSVDAVDIVLAGISGTGKTLKVNVIDYAEYKIPPAIKNYVLETSAAGKGTVDDICRLNFLLGNLYASNINKFLSGRGIKNSSVDFIGSHGQTIHHLPAEGKKFGYSVKSTLQIGDPSVIANKTGILTVGDFRTADVAAGGEGAPLVPYLDYALFRSPKADRILLNIGGISNVTYLRKNCSLKNVVAFDTGPGNMMIDYLASKFYGKSFDSYGLIAESGKVSGELVYAITQKDNFFKSKPPKSTGRELYGREFVDKILKKFSRMKKEDIIATFTFYTAFTIIENIRKFIRPRGRFELLVSGGGSNNPVILDYLRDEFPDSEVKVLDDNGINSSNKEAVLFAVLANETLHGTFSNVTSVTGANKNVLLGKICLTK